MHYSAWRSARPQMPSHEMIRMSQASRIAWIFLFGCGSAGGGPSTGILLPGSSTPSRMITLHRLRLKRSSNSNRRRQGLQQHAQEDRPDFLRRQIALCTRVVAQSAQPIAAVSVLEMLPERILRANVIARR